MSIRAYTHTIAWWKGKEKLNQEIMFSLLEILRSYVDERHIKYVTQEYDGRYGSSHI